MATVQRALYNKSRRQVHRDSDGGISLACGIEVFTTGVHPAK